MYNVVLFGKPNVGKSMLFNVLTGKKSAIVIGERNATRDIKREKIKLKGMQLLITDLGGWTDENFLFHKWVKKTIKSEIESADLIVALFDIHNVDEEDKQVAQYLRKLQKPTIYCANKVDQPKDELLVSDLYALGIEKLVLISCAEKINLSRLRELIFKTLPSKKEEAFITKNTSEKEPIKVDKKNSRDLNGLRYDFTLAIIGKPNVGKSSLVNLVLGEERSLVSNVSGTTRDSVSEYWNFKDNVVRIIDTAGIRRKNKLASKKKNIIEKFSVNQALGVIKKSDVCLLLVDAKEGLTTQDKKIASVVLSRLSGLIVVVNKWDLIKDKSWKVYEKDMRIDFPHIHKTAVLPISCKSGRNIGMLKTKLLEVWKSQLRHIPTPELNNLLKKAIDRTPPSLSVKGRLKLYYAVQVKENPIVVKCFINSKKRLTKDYSQYLKNTLIKEKNLSANALQLIFEEKTKKAVG